MKHIFFKAGQEGRNDILSYFLTIVLVGVFVVVAQIPITMVIFKSGNAHEAAVGIIDIQNLGIPEWLALALMLLSFAVGLLGLIWLIRAIHKRHPLTMFTAFEKMNWSKIGFSALLWLILAIIAELIAYAISSLEIYSFTFDARRFFPVLIISLLMFPLQTTFEEVFFRGYLMQGFGLAFKNATIPLIVTSVLFGLMHGLNPEVAEFGEHILWYYVGTGLFLGIITLMDESLELAMGVHAANNLFGALLVTFPSSALSTPALFTISEYNVGLMIGFWVVMVLIYMVIVQRKYEWSDWKKLVSKIEYNEYNEYNGENEQKV